MSFILDALKKEQAQQDPAARTALALDHQDRRRQRLVMYLVAGALCVNAGVLLWMFAPGLMKEVTAVGQTPVAAEPAATSSVPAPPPRTSAAGDTIARGPMAQAADKPAERSSQVSAGGTGLTSQSAQAAPQNPPSVTRSGDTPIASPAPAMTPAPRRPASNPRVIKADEPTRVSLSELPDGVRARFPGLSFSTHVYAEDPTLRAVVVNGERLAEGDTIGSLKLTEITDAGAVFRFEDYLVSISVLDSWD